MRSCRTSTSSCSCGAEGPARNTEGSTTETRRTPSTSSNGARGDRARPTAKRGITARRGLEVVRGARASRRATGILRRRPGRNALAPPSYPAPPHPAPIDKSTTPTFTGGRRGRRGRKPSSVARRGRPRRADDHSSRARVAARLEQPTRRHRAGSPLAPRASRLVTPRLPTRPCSGWGLPCHPRYRGRGGLLPRRFTLTSRRPRRRVEAVCFLWHFPRGHPHRALPGTLPCGARTFLGPPVSQDSGSTRLPPRLLT